MLSLANHVLSPVYTVYFTKDRIYLLSSVRYIFTDIKTTEEETL